MKILFTVQGEGRGHMTQAIAAAEMLRERGHEIVAVLLGGNSNKPTPEFFTKALQVEVERIASPAFVQHGNRGVSLVGSGIELLKNVSRYRESLQTISRTISQKEPDVLINFLEPLVGIFNSLHKPLVPTVAVGHQFMMQHPSYLKVNGHRLQRAGMMNYVRITGARSSKLALSFYPGAPLPEYGITVCPPILRRQVLSISPTAGDRLLVYLLFHGFSENIIEWSRLNPSIPIDCFYDKPDAPPTEAFSHSLTFHRLDGEKFLNLMARSRGVVCTAGFESISEAAYLGKPLLMVPVPNHVEQFINAWDAENTGLGIRDRAFALSRLIDGKMPPADEAFRAWVDRAADILIDAIESAAEGNGARDSDEDFEAVARSCAI